MNTASAVKMTAAVILGFLICLTAVTVKKDSPVSDFILADILPAVEYEKAPADREVVLYIEKKPDGKPQENDEKEYMLFDDGITNEYAAANYYIVSGRTGFRTGDIDLEAFKNTDLTVDKNSNGPQILIFHTHSSEMFADSDPQKGLSEGIWGVGEELKTVLERDYGFKVYHDTGRYDIVDGKTSILGSYERMEPEIKKILEKYPTIELVIDLHRDGLNDGAQKLVTDINGEKCAKVMLFNGLSRLKEKGGLKDIAGLENPYLKDNLALSYAVYKAAEGMHPGLMRKIYIEGYRYSLHMKPKSMLIEVGAQTNTKQEAKNSMKYIAKAIAAVVSKE